MILHRIITLVSRVLLELSFIRLLRKYLAHFKDSLSLDCYFSILRTFRTILRSIFTSVSSALLGFSFIGLLRLYLACFKDLLAKGFYVNIWHSFIF